MRDRDLAPDHDPCAQSRQARSLLHVPIRIQRACTEAHVRLSQCHEHIDYAASAVQRLQCLAENRACGVDPYPSTTTEAAFMA